MTLIYIMLLGDWVGVYKEYLLRMNGNRDFKIWLLHAIFLIKKTSNLKKQIRVFCLIGSGFFQ